MVGKGIYWGEVSDVGWVDAAPWRYECLARRF